MVKSIKLKSDRNNYMLYADSAGTWYPKIQTWPLQNSQSYDLKELVDKDHHMDLIASFLKMKVPRGQSYVMKSLSPTDFEYKLIEAAFMATGTASFDKNSGQNPVVI